MFTPSFDTTGEFRVLEFYSESKENADDYWSAQFIVHRTVDALAASEKLILSHCPGALISGVTVEVHDLPKMGRADAEDRLSRLLGSYGFASVESYLGRQQPTDWAYGSVVYQVDDTFVMSGRQSKIK